MDGTKTLPIMEIQKTGMTNSMNMKKRSHQFKTKLLIILYNKCFQKYSSPVGKCFSEMILRQFFEAFHIHVRDHFVSIFSKQMVRMFSENLLKKTFKLQNQGFLRVYIFMIVPRTFLSKAQMHFIQGKSISNLSHPSCLPWSLIQSHAKASSMSVRLQARRQHKLPC